MAIIGFRFPATSKYHPLGIDSFSPSTEKFRNWYPAEISAFGVDCAEAGTATHTSVTQSASIRTETRDMQLLLCRRHGGGGFAATRANQVQGDRQTIGGGPAAQKKLHAV